MPNFEMRRNIQKNYVTAFPSQIYCSAILHKPPQLWPTFRHHPKLCIVSTIQTQINVVCVLLWSDGQTVKHYWFKRHFWKLKSRLVGKKQ